MNIIWVRTLGVGNTAHPQRLGVTRVSPWPMCSSRCASSNCSRIHQLEMWARKYGNLSGPLFLGNNGMGMAPGTTKDWAGIISLIFAQMRQLRVHLHLCFTYMPCDPKTVPTMNLNHYFSSSFSFEFYYSIKKHKESTLWFWFGFELRVSYRD